MRSTNQLIKRLKGYHRTFRGRFLLLKNRALTDKEFILWDFSFSVLADWDEKNHPDTYGSFGHNQEEIGLLLGWHKTKVCRLSQGLFQKGFWTKRPDKRIAVVGYNITKNLTEITKEGRIVDLQEYLLKSQLYVAKIEQPVPNLQENVPKGNGNSQAQKVAKLQQRNFKASLVSSKVNSNVLRSEEEYQRIWEKGDYKMLTIDDMKWIDRNIQE